MSLLKIPKGAKSLAIAKAFGSNCARARCWFSENLLKTDRIERNVNCINLTILRHRVSPLATTVLLSVVVLATTIRDARAQENDNPPSSLGSVGDYMHEENPGLIHGLPELGVEVSDGAAQLALGSMRGPIVVRVIPDSPASQAGLRNQRSIAKSALIGAFLVGGLFFPPAIFGAIVVGESDIGESHDTIVAVDSERTRNVNELENAIYKSRQGPILYLSVVRGGHRNQVQVFLRPPNDPTK